MRCFIDTDPGLDDALAILSALGPSGLPVAGLTTVAGNVGLGQTTRNAAGLAALAGGDMPVTPGADKPLRRDPLEARHIHGEDGLRGVQLPDVPTPSTGRAARWLADMLVDGGPARLLCLGPLTNIAELIESRPSSLARIERLIVMGGAITSRGNTGPRSEFNFAADPDAAAIVLGSGLPVTLLPLDVTGQLRADRAFSERLAKAKGPVAATASALIEASFPNPDAYETRPLHDPCVTLFALRPDLFASHPMRVVVQTSGDDPGAVDAAPEPASTVSVVEAIAADKALALLLRLLCWTPRR